MGTDLEWVVRKVLGEIPMAYPCGSYRLQKAHCRDDRAGEAIHVRKVPMQGLVWPAYSRSSRELNPHCGGISPEFTSSTFAMLYAP